MNAILRFDLQLYKRSIVSYIALAFLLSIGIFAGKNFNLSAGEGVYLNSPYTTGFLTAILSLIIIFIATIVGSQLLFKEWDGRFDLIVFTTAVSKREYLFGRFSAYFLTVLFCFSCFYLGFIVGQTLRVGTEIKPGLELIYYIYPFFLFGFINALFVCGFLSLVAWTSRNKMLVVISGLLLYVLYIVLLMFSNSPFMSGSLPQSALAQTSSALLDPFGVSPYFQNSSNFTIEERNTQLVPLTGVFLLNRIIFTFLAFSCLYIAQSQFSFSTSKRTKRKLKVITQSDWVNDPVGKIPTKSPSFDLRSQLQAIVSFAKIDLVYIFKGILLPASSLILLFFLGMEMNGDIEKGIRMPQNFASSGLLATTINKNFFLLGALFITYFSNEIFWRSYSSGFSLIQNSTYNHSQKLKGHWASLSLLVIFFTAILVIEALVFQISYGYFKFDFKAYLGIIVFNTLPLMLVAGVTLMLNAIIKNKYIALGVTVFFTIIFTTPISKMITEITLFRFLSGFNGGWSDFNGYGSYLLPFFERWLFGLAVVIFLWLLFYLTKQKVKRTWEWSYLLLPLIIAVLFGFSFMKGFISSNEQADIKKAVAYEQHYKKLQYLPQPSITSVKTRIDLFPENLSYTIHGTYVLKNKTDKPISSILFNFPEDLAISKATFLYRGREHIIDRSFQW